MRLPNITVIKDSRTLRITLVSVLIFFILSFGALAFFYFAERNADKTMRIQDNFSRSLSEYDTQFSDTGANRDFERMNRELDKLEKKAIGVESWLSVLKRRRALARINQSSLENYKKSVNNAIQLYPMSQPVAAIAAEALIKNTAINREAEVKLREWVVLLNDPSFNTLRLGLHILLGDFKNPARAMQIPVSLSSGGIESIALDIIILKILQNDIRAAVSDIQTVLHSPFPSDNSLRLSAEFFYDFGDIERSAEIFSAINDEKARSREADALYLAGFQGSARLIWSMLSDSQNDLLKERSLYNLGVTADDKYEAAYFFEKLINTDMAYNVPVSAEKQFGLIYYSRLLDIQRAINVLEKIKPADYPYVDLELCKRQTPVRELGRQLAEAWLLLDRHYDNEELYRWVSWLFLFQRNYSELKILLNRIENLQSNGQWGSTHWAEVCRAIQLMFGGDLETAENILRSIPVEEADWTVHANLGRNIEAQRSPSRAIEQYNLAALRTENSKTSAKIQLRIAKCFSALGRSDEALRSLQYAIELDPENLAVRLEFEKLF
jgi:tetratricopeptide (TPR) repeat protein